MFRKVIHSIHSFSLVEMLVVLVLSSIVSAILYISFSMVSSWQTSLMRRYNGFNDKSEVYYRLKKDIDRSLSIIMIDENTLVCEFQEKEKRITYGFFSDFLVRRQDHRTDTFFCKLSITEFFHEGKPVLRGELVDEIKTDLLDFPEPVTMHVSKWYDRAALIEAQIDTIKNID